MDVSYRDAPSPSLYRSPVKRRRGSETDSTSYDTDHEGDETLRADDTSLPPTKKRREEVPNRGLGRLSLDQAMTTAPDSPTFTDEDEEVDMEEEERNGVLHPLVIEQLRHPKPLIPPLASSSNALVLYQPILRPTQPDEVIEEEEDDETPLDWPGKRRPRRNATSEEIELDEQGQPIPLSGSIDLDFDSHDGEDKMEIDE